MIDWLERDLLRLRLTEPIEGRMRHYILGLILPIAIGAQQVSVGVSASQAATPRLQRRRWPRRRSPKTNARSKGRSLTRVRESQSRRRLCSYVEPISLRIAAI